MARLSTALQKRHNAALELVNSNKILKHDEILTALADFQEGAEHLNGMNGAFFTPIGLARDFAIEVSGDKIIDLCAGVGSLSYACHLGDSQREITCVELNQDYVDIGKRVVPSAKWICRDVLDLKEDLSTEQKFDVAISNPPFGNIGGIGMFDLEVVRKASKIAKRGVFILPQASTPFRYSGRQSYSVEIGDKLQKWMDKTGIEFSFNCGIDCNNYINQWHGVKPVVEIVCCEFGD